MEEEPLETDSSRRAVREDAAKAEEPIDALAVLAVLPEYRRSFLEELERLSDGANVKLRFISGDTHLDATVRSSVHPHVTYVHNRHFFGRRFLWQQQAAPAGVKARVAIVDLNPRSITAWLILILRRLAGRRTLVWGHLNPRAGRDARTAPLRRFMRRLASGIITYTWTDAAQARAEDPAAATWVAANGLYPRERLAVTEGNKRYRILYVGRLEPAKRPMLAVSAFARAIDSLPGCAVLTLVGQGSEMQRLQEQVIELGVSARVEMLGHIGAYEELQQLYSETVVSISPGYAGLGLTQSLGFGVPMLVADDEPHAPEIELLTERTGAYFRARDAESLAEMFANAYAGRRGWNREEVLVAVRDSYSSTAMAEGFLSAILGTDMKGKTIER